MDQPLAQELAASRTPASLPEAIRMRKKLEIRAPWSDYANV
jgi:hypothetical protein